MTVEIYKKCRPQTLADVVGQDGAVSTLQQMIDDGEIPHALLFAGPSGCGKTTLARILAGMLGCEKTDYKEQNCAKDRGVDFVREVQRRALLKPMAGKCCVWVLDECHQLTDASQQALLKTLEDTPKHAYFFLATTDPHDLLPTIRTRCTDIKVTLLDDSGMETVIKKACKKSKVDVSDDVIERIVSVSEGSPRKALVILHQIKGLKDESAQLNAIESQDIKHEAIKIARALFDVKTDWGTMSNILKGVKEDPERLRYMVLGYADKVLLSSGSRRAYEIIKSFHRNFYDSKKAGLDASCYEVVTLLKR